MRHEDEQPRHIVRECAHCKSPFRAMTLNHTCCSERCAIDNRNPDPRKEDDHQ